ncbi:MAG: catalase [Clostridia bacterium]|nr:catalase [Clostridia bacterium]
MGIGNFFRHIALVIRHKNKVFWHCLKCGIVWRGIVHDLSKFSPTELFESAKYFTGYRSPIGVCREKNGVSHAWLHHKGRNKHHIEYWLDGDCDVTPLMPYVYAVECVCDKLAATKTYAGKNYTEDLALKHWLKHGNKVDGNPKTMLFIETVFRDLEAHGEKYILNKKYMRATYDRICLGKVEDSEE